MTYWSMRALPVSIVAMAEFVMDATAEVLLVVEFPAAVNEACTKLLGQLVTVLLEGIVTVVGLAFVMVLVMVLLKKK